MYNENYSNGEISNINKKGISEHYSPATKEWINSIYTYNKNYIKTLPIADKTINKLIRSYLNISSLFKRKRSKRVQIRFVRLSLNRILASKPEMKHSNNKVIITVHTYNKSKKILLYKLKNKYKSLLFSLKTKTPGLKQGSAKLLKTNTIKKNIRKHNVRKPTYLVKSDKGNKYYVVGASQSTHYPNKVNNKLLRDYNKTKKYPGAIFKSNKNKIITKKIGRLNDGYNLRYRGYGYTHYLNLSKSKIRKFIFNGLSTLNNVDLRNKYGLLAKKYYSMLNRYKLYNITKQINSGSNYNSNFIGLQTNLTQQNNLYTSNFYKGLKMNYASNTVNFNKSRKFKLNNLSIGNNINYKLYKKIKNNYSGSFIYKLKTFYKLFILENLYNNSKYQNINTKLHNTYLFSDERKKSLLSGVVKNTKETSSSKIKSKTKLISLKGIKFIKNIRKHKNLMLKNLKWEDKMFVNYENKYYKTYMKKLYKKELLYMYYLKRLTFNTNKFKNWFLLGLKKVISKIYNKKVEFNFIDLKYIYLNSDIFTESIAIKLRNRDNKLLRVLKNGLKLVKLSSINTYSEKANKQFFISNKYKALDIVSKQNVVKEKDILHTLLNDLFNTQETANKIHSIKSQNLNNIQKNVFNFIKHKAVFGVRLEAAGRLSKRLTASRSTFKFKYKGGLNNINYQDNKLPSAMLRGNFRPNLQYTKISSKTRNGSFGLKGWVNNN